MGSNSTGCTEWERDFDPMTEQPYQGPPESFYVRCGYCRLYVLTLWAPNNRGLLSGDYCLVGDVIFHNDCFDRMVKENPL